MHNENNGQFNTFQYLGAIHIHTKFSDGTGDIQSISKAAKKAGLDWIIITDHNSFDIEEGLYNGVYVIKGEEITPSNNNHYLAFGINKAIEPSDDPQTNINNVRYNGGFGFAAHPSENLNRKNKWKPIIWDNKNIVPDGVEIWNWFSSWGDNLNDRNIFRLAYSYFFKHKITTNPCDETLAWWDKLNNNSSKIIPAIGGVDAHALKIYRYILPVTVFPYKTCFKTITNVITLHEPLSDAFDVAKKQILTAIKSGNNLIINRNINNDIPQISISNNENIVSCGDSIGLDEDTYLNIETNETVDVKLIFNGNTVSEIKTRRCRIPIMESGKYRVELSYKGRGFGYTNPINVEG